MDSAVTGAIIALIGVGGLLSIGLELLRRRWAISDRRYNRQKEILDRRCDQAEEYAQSVTQDFRKLTNDIEAYLTLEDPYEVAQREKARKQWKEHLDTKIFSLGPSIHALSDTQLREAWDGTISAVDQLHGVYGKVHSFKIEAGDPMDANQTIETTEVIWLEFSARLGDFYSRLDRIRSELNLQRFIVRQIAAG